METTDQYFIDLLRSRSLKATPVRMELLTHMKAHKTAIPYSEIQKVMADVDRVTLFRTMDTLVNQGIIHQAYRENNDRYYALCGSSCDTEQHNHEHIHFKCTTCNEVTCQQLSAKLHVELKDYEIHQISINVTGICPSCRDAV